MPGTDLLAAVDVTDGGYASRTESAPRNAASRNCRAFRRLPEEAANAPESPPRARRPHRRSRTVRKFHSANASARSAMSSPRASDEVAAGEGALRTCSVPSASARDEVVDQRAVAPHGLGADAGRAALDVAGAQRRARSARTPPTKARACSARHAQLLRAGAPEAPHDPPRPRPAQAADEHRRRAEQDLAGDVAREVDAEERQVGIGHGVDEAATSAARVRAQAQVLPAEGRRCAGPAARPRPPPGGWPARRRRRPRGAR